MSVKAFELFGEISLKGGNTTLTGLKNVSTQANATERDLKKLRDEVDKSSKSHSNFAQGFLSSFGIQRGSGIGSLLGNAAGNLLQSGAGKFMEQMKDITTRGMELSDMVQKARLGYGQILGSDEKGVKLIKELVDLGNKTQFDTKGTLLYGQQLLAVGMRANEVTQALRDLGDAAASTGNFDKFDKALMAVTQMLSKGKVTAEEMRQQLSEAIPGSQGFMARGLGVSQAQLDQLMSEGRINAGPAVRLMLLQMRKERGGFLEKTSEMTFESLESIKRDAEAVEMAKSLHGGDLFDYTPDSARAQRMAFMKNQIARRQGLSGSDASAAFGKIAAQYFKTVDEFESFLFAGGGAAASLLGQAASTVPAGIFSFGFGKSPLQQKGEEWGKKLSGLIGQTTGPVDQFKNVTGTSIDVIEKGAGPMQQAGQTLAQALEQGIDDIWQFGSPSRKATQMGLWIREGLEIGLTKGQAKNYANLQALTKADPDFLRTLGIEAAKRGVKPDDMLNLMGIESSFNKSVMNQYGYGGLGQVGRDERKALGLPVNDAAFKQMLEANSASWQLSNVLFPFLDMKLKGNKGVLRDGQIDLYELYAMWGSGHATGDPNAIHMARGGKRAAAYANNPLWDFNKDGLVRESEFGQAAFAALGAGKFFSVNGHAEVSQSNPMPVQIVGTQSTPTAYDPNYKDPGLTQQIANSRNMYASRRSLRTARPTLADAAPFIDTINDPVPITVDALRRVQEPLETWTDLLGANAVQFKKLANVTEEVTKAEDTRLKSIADGTEKQSDPELEKQMAQLRLEAISAGQKKKRDKLFDTELTHTGMATDFNGELTSLLSGLGWEKPGSLGKQFLFGMLHDIQGRLAHDFSSDITEALFGTRRQDGSIMGGLFGRLFSKPPSGAAGSAAAMGMGAFMPGEISLNPMGNSSGIGAFFSKLFGGLFGGFRASGGGMSAGRFYLAGEHGPELIAGPGHVYNNRETRGMLSAGNNEQAHITVAIGPRAVADAMDDFMNSRMGRRRMLVHARYNRKLQGYA